MKNFLAKGKSLYYPSSVLKLKSFRISISTAILIIFSILGSQTSGFAFDYSKIAEEYRSKGFQEQQKGHLREALVQYSKAIQMNPQYAIAYNDLGLVYEQLGHADQAYESYLAAIEADKKYLPPYSNLGYFFKKRQNQVKALEYFQMRVELGDPADPWTRAAEREMEEILRTFPSYRAAVQEKAVIALNEMIQKRKEQELLEFQVIADQFYNAGVDHLNNQRYDEAIAQFEEGLNYVPDDPDLLQAKREAEVAIRKQQMDHYYSQAIELMKDGETESAQAEVRRMLTLVPDDTTEESEN